MCFQRIKISPKWVRFVGAPKHFKIKHLTKGKAYHVEKYIHYRAPFIKIFRDMENPNPARCLHGIPEMYALKHFEVLSEVTPQNWEAECVEPQAL